MTALLVAMALCLTWAASSALDMFNAHEDTMTAFNGMMIFGLTGIACGVLAGFAAMMG